MIDNRRSMMLREPCRADRSTVPEAHDRADIYRQEAVEYRIRLYGDMVLRGRPIQFVPFTARLSDC